MSGLKKVLLERIRQDGPLTVADYMAACLFDPAHGYYSTREPFGAAGDFVTSPEISQMFGELLGLALAQAWLDQGAPAPFVLAEFGPGRGTLMADVLRATRRVPGFHAAMRLCLLEASNRLRAVQQAALSGAAPVWIAAPEDLPEAPLFLLANEFFDALPVRQFLRDDAGWRERLVGVQGGDLVFGLSEPLSVSGFDPRFAGDPPGTLVELCPAARPFVAAVAARIRAHGGLAIIADYGAWRSRGDTLQALRRHRPADPLAQPGPRRSDRPCRFRGAGAGGGARAGKGLCRPRRCAAPARDRGPDRGAGAGSRRRRTGKPSCGGAALDRAVGNG